MTKGLRSWLDEKPMAGHRLYRREFFASCPTAGCQNHGLPLEFAPAAYRSAGRTASGSSRQQCKACKSTFSGGSPTRRHKKTDRTGDILLSLMNKVPISRMCETLGVTYGHIYSKIDFIAQQCLRFAAWREEKLAASLKGEGCVFATDAQVIMVNWPAKKRRRTIPLLHMATVHQGSQFVVAATIDCDPAISARQVDKNRESSGEFALPRSMRQQARLRSAGEYEAAMQRLNPGVFSKDDLAVGGQWLLPGTGSRVSTDIFLYAHMMLVKKRIGRVFRQALMCPDSESGLAAATAAIFRPEVLELSRLYRRVVCSTTRRPYRVSSGLHRTPPLLLRAGCIR